MKPYPPSGYLTQLVVRALLDRKKLPVSLADKAKEWAWSDLAKQLGLIQAKSKSQDAFTVAYLLILVTMLTPESAISSERSSIQRAALKTFFDCQFSDGTWPLSRPPLFHYLEIGNAYCYEYEMLTQLLQQQDLKGLLIGHLPQINLSVEAVANGGYRIKTVIRAWS